LTSLRNIGIGIEKEVLNPSNCIREDDDIITDEDFFLTHS
jgi:hypothetical protein